MGGERVIIKSDWFYFLSTELFYKNAIEIGMDRYILLRNLTIACIPLNNVRQTYKTSKIGLVKGMTKDIYYVLDWMAQLGIFSFSCTYLFVLDVDFKKEGKLVDLFKKIANQLMFAKNFLI